MVNEIFGWSIRPWESAPGAGLGSAGGGAAEEVCGAKWTVRGALTGRAGGGDPPQRGVFRISGDFPSVAGISVPAGGHSLQRSRDRVAIRNHLRSRAFLAIARFRRANRGRNRCRFGSLRIIGRRVGHCQFRRSSPNFQRVVGRRGHDAHRAPGRPRPGISRRSPLARVISGDVGSRSS
jgi:hypothetical protein